MPNVVDLLMEKQKLRDILLDELEILVPAEVGDIIYGASDEIIDANDSMSLGEKVISEVRSEEPCGSGNNRNRSCVFLTRGFGHNSFPR